MRWMLIIVMEIKGIYWEEFRVELEGKERYNLGRDVYYYRSLFSV